MDSFFTVLFRHTEDSWHATVPALPDVSATAEDQDTCRRLIRTSIRMYLEIHGQAAVQEVRRETLQVGV